MKIISETKHNTNNGWGFGGWIGTLTEYDNGVIVRKGRACHRHTGTSSANAVSVRIEDGFSVYVKKSADSLYPIPTLKGVVCISVFENDGHYLAIAKDIDNISKYGEEYKLINKIQIETA
jgi:hypothetical protein